MPLFGAAFALRSLSALLIPTENRIEESKDFSRPLCDFPVFFKADLIFKDFSRKPSKFKYFSSLCEPCYSTQTDQNSISFWPV